MLPPWASFSGRLLILGWNLSNSQKTNLTGADTTQVNNCSKAWIARAVKRISFYLLFTDRPFISILPAPLLDHLDLLPLFLLVHLWVLCHPVWDSSENQQSIICHNKNNFLLQQSVSCIQIVHWPFLLCCPFLQEVLPPAQCPPESVTTVVNICFQKHQHKVLSSYTLWIVISAPISIVCIHIFLLLSAE